MAYTAMFQGLVYDTEGNPIEVSYIGNEAHYVINDQGFMRHVESEPIDREIISIFLQQIQGNSGEAVDQALRMMGQDDIFTKAAIEAEIKNADVNKILGNQIPAQARDMMAMMGFRIMLNYRGELVGFDQPSAFLGDDL